MNFHDFIEDILLCF